MNDYLDKLFLRRILNEFSEKDRLIYRMVIKMEDKLTESILTAEQYMIQVKKYSLHEEIAKHFNMPLFELLEVMKELEGKIHKKLKEMHAKVLWVDYTEIISRMDKDSRNKKWFYVTIPSN